MSKVNIKDLVALLQEQINNNKTVSFTPKGMSMKPMLDGENDVVFLKKPNGKLHFLDVCLYYRKETNVYSIHRVVDFTSNGDYVMLGDNNFKKEYNITDDDVIGVVTSFYHKGKHISVDAIPYRLYCHFWYYSKPFRLIIAKLKCKFKKKDSKK